MLQYERINAVVSLTLVGLALYFVLEFPSRSIRLALFETSFELTSPQRWLMVCLLVGLVMAGTDMIMRSHPALLEYRLSYLATFWMLPGLLVMVATQILGLIATPVLWGASLVGVGLLLWLTIVAEFQYIPTRTPPRHWAYLWQQFMGYSLALTMFFMVYQTYTRNVVAAVLVLLVSSMVALSLLRQKLILISKTWLFALIIGVALGQIAWVLGYWQLTPLHTSLILTLYLYVLIGLTQQHLVNRLSRRTLAEFGLVTLVGLAVIYYL